MPHALDDQAIGRFNDQGFVFPVPVLDPAEVADCRAALEAHEARHGGTLPAEHRAKSHLLFAWIDDLIRDGRILDPIEDLIGPDILCWNTIFWIKEAGSKSFVSWHQDINYWGLAGGEVITAWLALSPATPESGCMRVLPGSHLDPAMAHRDSFDADNMLTRGQQIAAGIDEAAAVPMALEPGEMSLHSVRLAHASGANLAADRRIGLSLHFMPTSTYQRLAERDTAALVRGHDSHGHFDLTPRVERDFDPDLVAYRDGAMAALRDILYQGAEQTSARL